MSRFFKDSREMTLAVIAGVSGLNFLRLMMTAGFCENIIAQKINICVMVISLIALFHLKESKKTDWSCVEHNFVSCEV